MSVGSAPLEPAGVTKRESWSSTLLFVFACIANAVGLGNVWRFPFITGKYGGAAFVVVYLCAVVLLAVPLMLAEFSIGRYARKNAVDSLKTLSPGTPWYILGYSSLLVALVVLSFYSSVAGWLFHYLLLSLKGSYMGLTPDKIAAMFGSFVSSPAAVIGWQIVVMAYTVYVVSRGISGGIEKVVNFMLPALLVIELALAIVAVMLPGAGKGLSFYLKPDFSKLTMQGVLAAVGQVFFSLNVGAGQCLLYASYQGKDSTLLGSSAWVGVGDTTVALLAGLIIFPAAFAFGINPDAGPSLVFITLPNVFSHMRGGQLFGAAFYLFLLFAALTSTIAMLEMPTSFLCERLGWSRQKSALVSGVVIFAVGILSSLSFGPLAEWKPFFGRNFFEFEDFFLSNILMPVGGILYAIFVGWVWGIKPSLEEINTGSGMKLNASLYSVAIRYIVPVIVFVILITGLGLV